MCSCGGELIDVCRICGDWVCDDCAGGCCDDCQADIDADLLQDAR